MSATMTQTIPAAAALDTHRATAHAPLQNQLMEIRQSTGLRHGTLIMAFARLARGPGKVSFPDFVRLRLFDAEFHGGSDLQSYVGQRRNRDICVTVNYRHDWYGLMSDKVAVEGYLSSYGLPTIPIVAIYAEGLSSRKPQVLSDRAGLETFLSATERLPLFGKPAEGFQSLGSVALRRFSRGDRAFETTDGRHVALEDLVADIVAHYGSGYVFQPLVRPHPNVAQLCGERLPCARIVTGLTESGPKVLRACWKIPAGQNMADNYWRPGNLLAQLDMDTGRVLRVTSGAGLETRGYELHPDSGKRLTGFVIPDWQEMKTLALQGARLMRHMPLIGWDIAPSVEGPVIVEMNETPDFFLVQFADRRGILDDEFRAFMEFQGRRRAEHDRAAKADIAKL